MILFCVVVDKTAVREYFSLSCRKIFEKKLDLFCLFAVYNVSVHLFLARNYRFAYAGNENIVALLTLSSTLYVKGSIPQLIRLER